MQRAFFGVKMVKFGSIFQGVKSNLKEKGLDHSKGHLFWYIFKENRKVNRHLIFQSGIRCLLTLPFLDISIFFASDNIKKTQNRVKMGAKTVKNEILGGKEMRKCFQIQFLNASKSLNLGHKWAKLSFWPLFQHLVKGKKVEGTPPTVWYFLHKSASFF